MKTTKTISIRWHIPGFHRWKDAPTRRGYLRERHRHLFHIEVELGVRHDDREVEYHDLLDWCRARLGQLGVSVGEFGDRSCEAIAETLGEMILEKWPDRSLAVSVWEDGECGSTVRWETR